MMKRWNEPSPMFGNLESSGVQVHLGHNVPKIIYALINPESGVKSGVTFFPVQEILRFLGP
jgi:hypothetical protein